eukprot:14777289-Alexandrium_andersonii.AAC.1
MTFRVRCGQKVYDALTQASKTGPCHVSSGGGCSTKGTRKGRKRMRGKPGDVGSLAHMTWKKLSQRPMMPLPVMRKGGPTLPFCRLHFERSSSGAPTQQCDHTWSTSGGLQRTSGG